MTKPRLRQATLRLKVTRWLKVQPLKEMHPPHPEAQRGHHLGHGHTGHPRSHSAQSSPRQTSWGVCHTLCLPLSLQLPPPPLLHIPHRVSQASLPGTSQQAAPKKTRVRGGGSLLGPPERLVRTTAPYPSACAFQNNFAGRREKRGPPRQNTDYRRASVTLQNSYTVRTK